MCGICGGIGINSEQLQSMVDAMQHRGHDDEGQLVTEGVALGMRRLAIIDLRGGGQPITNEDGTVAVVFNGEIYNFRELRKDLIRLGHDFKTESDTEVIVHAYEEWGRGCLDYLRGMFAFAICDHRSQLDFDTHGEPSLFLARDRVGIKPLYYYRERDCFLFASEIRALLASGRVPRRADPIAVWEYLGYQSVPAPRTIIQNIHMLPPGCWMSVDENGKLRIEEYWNPLTSSSDDGKPPANGQGESRRAVGELLREAVKLRLVSDVPIGAFLSGGIDSSAVVALMREAAHTPRTFSIIFAEDAYDEAEHARVIARRFETEHSEIYLSEEEILKRLPEALDAMDHPTGDGINTYIVSRAVRRAGIKVALSGLGGDELFGGYPSFSRLPTVTPILSVLGGLPLSVRVAGASILRMVSGRSVSGMKAAAMVESDGQLSSLYPITRQVWSQTQREKLLAEPLVTQIEGAIDPYVQFIAEAYASAPKHDRFSRISFAEIRTYMHDVLLRDTDQMSMAHGLEVRVPLLDHRLVQYVMQLPEAYKRSNGTPKRLLVESIGILLPDSIVDRPKQGFTLPFELWMRGRMRGYCEERLDPSRLAQRGVLDSDQVQRFWQAFLAGHGNASWSRLWTLIVLEEWLEINEIGL